jgi:preprotein translocase subunit SecA
MKVEDHAFETYRDPSAFSAKGTASKAPIVKAAKIGPNDPCTCGSGKKYKKCCEKK